MTRVSHSEGASTSLARASAAAEKVLRGVLLNREGRRSQILRKALFDVAGRAAPSIAVERDGVWFFVDTGDRVLGRATFAVGAYEPGVMAEAIGVLERYGHPLRGRAFIDVGANIGTATVIALTRFGASRAVAIEPSPRNHMLLRCNVIANGLEERVVTVRAGASAAPGTARLALSAHNSGDHRVLGADHAADGRRTVEVPLVTLDGVLAEHGVDPAAIGLVWIDTQGHEAHVLRGATELLSRGVPVIAEYWPYGLRQAGGTEALHALIERHFDLVIDVRSAADGRRPEAIPAADVRTLEARYPEETFTDLILLRGG